MYKNSTKEGDNVDKEEEVEIDCEIEIINFLPYYNKATKPFSDTTDTFDLALCHYISNGSGDGTTFEQFLLHQQSIENNNVIVNNNSESSTVTETIADMCLVNKFFKKEIQKCTGLHFRNDQFE